MEGDDRGQGRGDAPGTPVAEVDVDGGMVGEVRPYSRQVGDPAGRPDSRAEQDRRTAVDPSAEDNVPSRDARPVREPHTYGPAAADHIRLAVVAPDDRIALVASRM
jgi:hypothetical protein